MRKLWIVLLLLVFSLSILSSCWKDKTDWEDKTTQNVVSGEDNTEEDMIVKTDTEEENKVKEEENKVKEEVKQSSTVTNIGSEFTTYTNTEHSFEMKYPSSYELKENQHWAVLSFLAKREGETDMFQENLNLIVQDLTESPMTLDEYSKLSLEQVETLLENWKIAKKESVKLDWMEAYMVIYTWKYNWYDLKWKQIWTIIDSKAYIISYTGEEKSFDDYIVSMDKIIESFKMTK